MKNNQAKVCNPDDLVLYHYGELSAERCSEIEKHLGVCPACRKALEELRQTLAVVPPGELNLSREQTRCFTDRVMKSVDKKGRSFVPVWGSALAAAAALVITFVSQGPDTRPVPNEVPGKMVADPDVVKEMELLQDFELLENLELLQELEGRG